MSSLQGWGPCQRCSKWVEGIDLTGTFWELGGSRVWEITPGQKCSNCGSSLTTITEWETLETPQSIERREKVPV